MKYLMILVILVGLMVSPACHATEYTETRIGDFVWVTGDDGYSGSGYTLGNMTFYSDNTNNIDTSDDD